MGQKYVSGAYRQMAQLNVIILIVLAVDSSAVLDVSHGFLITLIRLIMNHACQGLCLHHESNIYIYKRYKYLLYIALESVLNLVICFVSVLRVDFCAESKGA